MNLRRYKADRATPAEAHTEEAEQGHVKAVRPSLDLGQDLAVVLRDAGREGLLALLALLAAGLAIESARRDFFEVGILKATLAWSTGGRNIQHQVHTSLPNLFSSLSPKILFAMNLAANDILDGCLW